MNTGLIHKAAREIALVTLLSATGLFLFETIITYVFWTYQKEFTGDFLQIEFVSNLVNAMVGSRAGTTVGPSTLQSLAWIHPLVLTFFFAQVITVTTRLPAGEVDGGTADVLLALPVSRWALYRHETLVWMCSGVALLIAAMLGNQAGNLLIAEEGRLPVERIFIIAVNLFLLYAFVGAMASLLSCYANSRGRAVGTTVSILLILFLWNFLEQYWTPAQQVGFLNILSYYKPAPILDTGEFPWRDCLVLATSVLGLLFFAGRHFHRRDINTL